MGNTRTREKSTISSDTGYTQSSAFSFVNTGSRIAKGAFYAALSGIVAYLVTVVPTMDFGAQMTPVVIAVALFVANAIKEFVQERE